MKISVIITAYNVSDFIERAVKSVLSQTYKNIEVIIVEDCSTDNTKDIIEQLAKEDDRIKIIYHKENKGAGWGRRDGIETSTGDYFITVDGDDWLDEDFIESLVKKAKETNADIVSGGITINKEKGYYEATSYGDIITLGDDKVTMFWGEKIVFMNNKIIKKELHNKVPYCTRRFIEDTPTIIPMMWYANMVAYTSNVGYHYQMNNNSLTHTADSFKYALYRSLCILDLIDFFNKNDKTILEKLPIHNVLKEQLKIIKLLDLNINKIKDCLDDWLEFSKRILKWIQ